MFDELCALHGGLGHVFVHEAAHVVAAVQRDIRFDDVRILAPAAWIEAHGGLMLGGVALSGEPRSWALTNPLACLEFAIAGALAERMAYGHTLQGAHEGDVATWRVGAGLTAAQDAGAIASVIGLPLPTVISNVERWVESNWSVIRRVVGSLAGVPDLSEAAVLEFKDGWRLTEAEVVALTE